MGPDLFGREIGGGRATALWSGAPLQWGPTCSVGRSASPPSRPRASPECFNGARPVRSGDRANAGEEGADGEGASMGPDLFGREIGADVVELTLDNYLLQWGPTCSVGRSGSESSACRGAHDEASMGPDLFGREIGGDRAARLRSQVCASMGPDLFGREIGRAHGFRLTLVAGASMGPDLFGREIETWSKRTTSRQGSFNGARPVRSGDRRDYRHQAAVDNGLQWGPTCSVGRSPPQRWSWGGLKTRFNGARPVRSGDRHSGRWWMRRSGGFNGARPVRSGDRPTDKSIDTADCELQWGPTCSVGRSGSAWHGREGRTSASMGPDLFGREIGRSDLRQGSGYCQRFNGARPVRSGDRLLPALPSSPATVLLQWGPTCSVGRSGQPGSGL